MLIIYFFKKQLLTKVNNYLPVCSVFNFGFQATVLYAASTEISGAEEIAELL